MSSWSRADLFAFLAEQPRIGRLATMTPEQDPHVAPVWFRVADDRILVHTMAGYKKARNLANHPRFALTVDTEEWPYKGVTIRGSATLVEADVIDHKKFVENVTVSYLGEAYRPMGRAMGSMAGDHVILERASIGDRSSRQKRGHFSRSCRFAAGRSGHGSAMALPTETISLPLRSLLMLEPETWSSFDYSSN